MKTTSDLAESNFLVKSAFGISLAALLISLPFGINNFIQERLLSGIVSIAMVILFAINAYAGWRGKYLLYLNLFGIVPAFTFAAVNAIVSLQVLGTYWSFLCAYGIYFILPFRYAKFANAVFLIAVISAAWYSLELSIFIRFSVVLVGTSIFIFISNREITKTQRSLRKQAITDPLTGAFNRVCLPKDLEQAILNFEDNGVKSTICVLDIDHFKSINDTYGHETGDQVLIDLSSYILSFTSSKDTLFRIGGEEFLILMDNTDEYEGAKTAEALRAVVEDYDLLENHKVTVSVGVSEIQKGFTWKTWMKLSDEKLYTAKRNGRNQVVHKISA